MLSFFSSFSSVVGFAINGSSAASAAKQKMDEGGTIREIITVFAEIRFFLRPILPVAIGRLLPDLPTHLRIDRGIFRTRFVVHEFADREFTVSLILGEFLPFF